MKRALSALAAAGCLLLCLEVWALDVDMDPVPRFPLRKDDSQVFLIHLSGAKADCQGAVSFEKLPEGLAASPAKQNFRLERGESRLLVFTVKNTAWGADAVVRPVVTVTGDEPVNFPERLKTTFVRVSWSGHFLQALTSFSSASSCFRQSRERPSAGGGGPKLGALAARPWLLRPAAAVGCEADFARDFPARVAVAVGSMRAPSF